MVWGFVMVQPWLGECYPLPFRRKENGANCYCTSLSLVCVCQLWVCVYLRGADMYLETLITSVNQQGC